MWTPGDDELLRLCAESGVSFRDAAAEMPFTCCFTARDLASRWHRILCDAECSQEAALEMVSMHYGAACPKATTPGKKGHHPQRQQEPSGQLAASLLASAAPPSAAIAHGTVPIGAGGGDPPAQQPPLAAVDGRASRYLVYGGEFAIGRRGAAADKEAG
eukprot:CAMPEP_0174917866 /NCGR_PEP_ID=MMETSP1355-20121228/2751_1 /TAXON_ID=464990 /ORGANISM="Hemiselmis tepida, Strain CCMP443" /LENGTH=158 /DNA_ID=CAMNT_0016163009 /DNA_START=1 /DNA_END=474 /DNA_ORIENTATION=-